INQDYAWGQDSKKDFTLSMGNLFPGAKPGEDQLPKFGAGQYGTEISALMAKPADVTHSSLWGGDLQAFVLQAAPRGLFKRTQVVFSAADHVLPGLGDKMPDGVILGARGAYGLMSPKSALNDWWWDLYSKAYNTYPVQAPYRMVQSLLGLKLAVDTAIGKTRYDPAKKMVVLEDIQRFPADCVNPPANMKSEDWIKAGFPGAKGCP